MLVSVYHHPQRSLDIWRDPVPNLSGQRQLSLPHVASHIPVSAFPQVRPMNAYHASGLCPVADGTHHILPDPQSDHRLILIREELWVLRQASHGFGQPRVATGEGFMSRNSIALLHRMCPLLLNRVTPGELTTSRDSLWIVCVRRQVP